MNRRSFFQLAAGGASTLILARWAFSEPAQANTNTSTPIKKLLLSNAEWKRRLTPTQYRILREEGTEAPFTSPLNHEKRAGMFACAGCDLPLFPSRYKFESGTGWPSFYDVLPDHIETKTDYKLGMPRTEYHCARCGGHHGHVFNDGPRPTGLRHCNNGAVLKFIPDKA